MRRRDNTSESELPGQDSFLDIVANIVGILILLVVVVGLRTVSANSKPADEQPPAASPIVTQTEVEEAAKHAQLAMAEAADKAVKLRNALTHNAQRDAERVELATFVAKLEEELDEKREKMDVDQRRSYDIRKQLGEAKFKLEELTREQIALTSFEPEAEVVEAVSTPLAKEVSDDEIHLRLSGGRVVIVPIDMLIERMTPLVDQNVGRLRSRDGIVITAGPVGGFRMELELKKVALRMRHGGTITTVSQRWHVLPVDESIGEPVSDAIAPNSILLTMLATETTRKPKTITVWVYSDSFAEYRDLKQALFERGYRVAARPLPKGVKIGGSPSGSKSAAQ